jgi:hypothetical protein
LILVRSAVSGRAGIGLPFTTIADLARKRRFSGGCGLKIDFAGSVYGRIGCTTMRLRNFEESDE